MQLQVKHEGIFAFQNISYLHFINAMRVIDKTDFSLVFAFKRNKKHILPLGTSPSVILIINTMSKKASPPCNFTPYPPENKSLLQSLLLICNYPAI